jgi:hypothetical protein
MTHPLVHWIYEELNMTNIVTFIRVEALEQNSLVFVESRFAIWIYPLYKTSVVQGTNII